MLILVGHATTPDKLKLVTSGAADVDTHVSYADVDNSLLPAAAVENFANEHHTITTATTTDICAGSTNANFRRNVKHANIRNTHATVPTDVTVILDAIDGNDYELFKTTLLPGDVLYFIEGVGWFKAATAPATPEIVANASTAAQSPAVTDTYITNSNLQIGGRTKLGTVMTWNLHISKTAAGVATPIFVMRFGTAGAIGDTARVTLTGPAQTAVVDNADFELMAVVWTAGASGIVRGQVSLSHSAAVAAGFGECFVGATSAAFDLTANGLQVGLSCTPGTAAAWTINQVKAEAFNLN